MAAPVAINGVYKPAGTGNNMVNGMRKNLAKNVNNNEGIGCPQLAFRPSAFKHEEVTVWLSTQYISKVLAKPGLAKKSYPNQGNVTNPVRIEITKAR